MLYSKFQKISRACSRNFTQFSRNFGYFSHFWANFNMLGIKMHVLELRNSLVILSKNFTRVFTQFQAKFPGCESRNHMWKITTYMVKEPHTAHTDYLNTENWNVCLYVKKCLKLIPYNVYEKHYLMVDNILWKEFNMKEVSIKSGAA